MRVTFAMIDGKRYYATTWRCRTCTCAIAARVISAIDAAPRLSAMPPCDTPPRAAEYLRDAPRMRCVFSGCCARAATRAVPRCYFSELPRRCRAMPLMTPPCFYADVADRLIARHRCCSLPRNVYRHYAAADTRCYRARCHAADESYAHDAPL